VEVRYEPPEAGDDEGEGNYVEEAVRAVERIFARRGGFALQDDILVFMPTENDILETRELLNGRGWPDTEVLPLYARLSAPEQARVFSSHTGRRIIVATNVAETSVTLPGIRYVVDTGLARISRYSPRTRTTSIPISRISRSSADQRKGRAGRVAPGVCIRLYDDEEFLARPEFTPPEILRSNLAEVVLRMMASSLGDPARFPFVDPPMAKSLQDAYTVLQELGAVAVAPGPWKKAGHRGLALTDRGRVMARLPVDPRLSRILLQAREEGCLAPALVVVSALSIVDPRRRPADSEAEADRARKTFEDPRSDFLTLVNLWNAWTGLDAKGASGGQKRKFCKENFLSFGRMREWRDVYQQIRNILTEESAGEIPPPGPVDPGPYPALHRAVLAGYLSNVALVKEKNLYLAARGREVMLFPGSALFGRGGRYVVAAEMVQTSRLFARTAAVVEPGWIEEMAGDLCKRTYTTPRWDRKRGEVKADERVTLYGLPLAEGRQVSFGRIHPEEASRVFIAEALLEHDLPGKWPFLEHNQKMVTRVRDMEERLRRRDLAADDARLAEWYEGRLENAFSVPTLRALIKKQGTDAFLRLSETDVLEKIPEASELALFPKKARAGGETFSCAYQFAPGDPADGATVRVPAALASVVDPGDLARAVQGVLRARVEAMVRGLPKTFRKSLVPAAEKARVLFQEVSKGRGSLAADLSAAARRRFSVDIPPSAWPDPDLPDHLKLRVALLDATGREVAAGRDLPDLLRRFANRAQELPPGVLDKARKTWEKIGLTQWDFGDLPTSVALDDLGTARAFPALVAGEKGVDVKLFTHPAKAARAHPAGVAALARVALKRELPGLARAFALTGEARTAAAFFKGPAKLEKELAQAFFSLRLSRPVRTQEEFKALVEEEGPRLFSLARDRAGAVERVLAEYGKTRELLSSLFRGKANPTARQFLEGILARAGELLPPSFPSLYSDRRLGDVARYLAALRLRAERGLPDPARDAAKEAKVRPFEETLRELALALPPDSAEDRRQAVEELHWLIQEFRVSLFAQEMKTAVPVSEKRLEKKVEEIRRMA
ncbi:MAG: ATP-dependent RNA helicase HrpA, partial [Pseudomonadota bacterium]